MRHLNTSISVVLLGVALSGGVARADDVDPSRPANLILPVGMSVNVGGGFAAFAEQDMRDFAGTAGAWNARVTVGTRQYVALEGAYLGSAQTIDAIGLDNDAILVGNGLEASIRATPLPHGYWQPYVLAGAAWRHYDVTNAEANTSDIADSDDVMEVPLGVGVSFRYQGLIVDGRGEFRAAFDDDLVATDAAGSPKDDLHTLGANITVGWEF